MSEPERAVKLPRPAWTSRAKLPADPNRLILPPNDGPLTEPLSRQKRFLRYLIGAGMAGGLMPAVAVSRGTDCLETLRNEAITRNYDSEQQSMVMEFALAGIRAPGVTKGFDIAIRAVEAVRLVGEWRVKVRKVEVAKAKRKEVQ